MGSHTQLNNQKQAICFFTVYVMSSSFKRDFACCWLALKMKYIYLLDISQQLANNITPIAQSNTLTT